MDGFLLVNPRAPAEALRALRSWPLGPTRSESRRISWNPVMIRPSWPVGCRPVLVANNAYALDPPTIGARERLDEGKLHLYVPESDPAELIADRFAVDAAAGRLEAAVDGEPDVLEMPVEFRIEPLR